ncbi:outer membrane beta-barrel protein [Pontibacter cellulosilyticus]|uniref:Outer membrane beta-barrel protein n=1 Tax=Pontibacter cellulosilyticus TaxID=1720253 RepID=A0A923N3F8_9BACT|nr:outer membrane beta-barrel protein [Pontibacter cellulosilyticus]MBC5991533.1 outer membrane beta-barrel protein [Pontibacter cellulosilyticus]
MKRLLPILLLLIGTINAYAQSVAVFGTVASGSDKTALPGANVVLKKTTDATVTATVTDAEGKFRFERVASGQYTVEINYIGFDKFSRTIQVQGAPLNLGQLSLQDGSTALKEVQVVGRAPLGEQKGDTTQFNAKAFKTAPDASAEDLVTKMPGITIQEGRVQAQGEDVKQVMIDGKRFTGDDVNSAIRNISADMIESVEVFDAQSDRAAFSGFDDGNRLKTLNFRTKREARIGYTGKASAGYGTDDRYMVGATVNFFNNNRRISLTGLTNNINMFDYSIGETPGGGMRGRRMFGGGSPNGIINTNNFSISYNDMWGKKMEVSGNYSYSNRETVNNLFRFQDYFATDLDREYRENSINNNTNESHRFNFRLQYNINQNNRLLITPNISFQNINSLRNSIAQLTTNAGTETESVERNNNETSSFNFSNNILYSHRFGDSGRILTANFSNNYSSSNGDLFELANITDYRNTNRSSYRNQFISTDKENMSWNGNLNYSQRLAENSRLQLEYTITNQLSDSDRRAFDFVETNNTHSDFNRQLSNTFQSDYISQSFGPSYQYRLEKVRFQADVKYQYATLKGENEFPEVFNLKRNFNNILPSAEYEYKFTNSRNLNISLRTNTNTPSVEQLQDVLDISNTLQPRIGNPELDQDFQSRINVRYRNFNPETNKVFFIGMFGTVTQNYVANSVYTIRNENYREELPFETTEAYTIPVGARLTRPVNLDGFVNVRSFFNYGQPISFIRSNLNLNGSIGYSRIPGMIDGAVNYANTKTAGFGLNISSNISEKVDFNVSTFGNYNIVDNTLQNARNNNYYTQNTSLRYNWILWKDMVYRTELNHQYNSGLSAGVDNSFLLWNMSLGKKIFKNKQGEISLSVNDLLKQNVSIQRNIAADYIEDVQSTVLQRYFMATFSYNLRKFKSGGNQPDPEQNRNRGNWGGGRMGH